MAVQIQIRRDTATNFTSNNPTLAEGEIGFETDTAKIKFGDGSTAWTSLNYIANAINHDDLTGFVANEHLLPAAIDHDALLNFVTAEHVDWAASSAGTIHITNFAALQNVLEDTTPELGGEMDAGAHTIGFTQQSQTGDGTTTIDWKLGNKDFHTFGAQNETFVFTAPTNPCNILLVLKQDSTGSRTVTWPAAVKWPGGTAPTLTTAGNSIDIIAFYYDGTSYYGVDSLDFS